MDEPQRSGEAIAGIRRLRGVSWEWRDDAPVERAGREAGVIAQDVQAVFPDLVKTGSHGYLTVNYRGLATRIGEAVIELEHRIDRLSDADAKRDIDPVDGALARLESGEGLERADYTALVGALVEAVKELDERVLALERKAGPKA